MAVMQVSVDDQTRDEITKTAKSMGVSVSAYFRMLHLGVIKAEKRDATQNLVAVTE